MHSDEVIASCTALQTHLDKAASDADALIREWEEGVRARELAEKRRVAPGWLDREEKMLEPERRQTSAGVAKAAQTETELQNERGGGGTQAEVDDAEGRELDEAFGIMSPR